MLTPKLSMLNKTGLTNLVRADPLSLDGPHSATPVVRIISGEVAVFDQTPAGMIAEEVDDFELQ